MKNLILTLAILFVSILVEAATVPFVFTRDPLAKKLFIIRASEGITYYSSTESIKFNGIVTITELGDFDISEDSLKGKHLRCDATGAMVNGRYESFTGKKCGPAGELQSEGHEGEVWCMDRSAFLCSAKYSGYVIGPGEYRDDECPIAFHDDGNGKDNTDDGDEIVLFFLDWQLANNLNTLNISN